MRKVLKALDVIFIGLLLTVFALLSIVSKFTINKNHVEKTLDNSGAYTVINNEIKEQVKSSLINDKNKEIKQLNINQLVDEVVTEDILKKEIKYILDELYDNGNLKLNKDILIEGYTNNLNAYYENHNIKLPDILKKQLNSLIINKSITIDDITPNNDNYIKIFNTVKDLVDLSKFIILSIIIILLVLNVILCKEKLRGVYIPFIISGLTLITVNCCTRILLNSLNLTIDKAKMTEVIDIVKKSFFSCMNLYCGIFLGIGLVGVVAREIIDIRKRYITDKIVEDVEKV